jgi:hypothetical protein
VTEEDQGPHAIGDRMVYPPHQGPAVLELVDDPHVPERPIRWQWLLHDVADGGVETGMGAGRRGIDVVQVRREVGGVALDPARASKADPSIVE